MIRYVKYTLIASILFVLNQPILAQQSIFDDQETIELVKKVADRIYGMEQDSARHYMAIVKSRYPDHPIVPMVEAVCVLWSNIPVLQDSVFEKFNYWLLETVAAAERMPPDHPDAIFFEMSARGLLGEYYADRGSYMKAFGEASQAYSLLKEGFELSKKYPEFLFAVGLYNYFRVAYPEKHPIYKPLIWFFRDGDKEMGLRQLKRATKEAVIIRVEAYVYLSYIYLRYEEKPELSRKYISELLEQYPKNPYVQAKYLEAHYSSGKLDHLDPVIISSLLGQDRPYYQLVGHLYTGVRAELIEENMKQAFEHYEKAIKWGDELKGYATYYKSLAHLGLGRIYYKDNLQEAAREQFRLALENAETDDVKAEANRWMNK